MPSGATTLVSDQVVQLDGDNFISYRNALGDDLMSDVDIGTIAKLSRPRDIRRVIESNLEALGPVCALARGPRTSAGKPSTEYYLTERQAHYVIAKCRTKGAAEQMGRLSAVYALARKGQGAAAVAVAQNAAVGPASSDPLDIAEQMVIALKAQRAELQRLSAQQTELAATQAAQTAALQAIQQERALAAQSLKEYPVPPTPELPEISQRGYCNRVLRDYCKSTGADYHDTWTAVYTEFRYRYHIDLKARAESRKISAIAVAEADGLSDKLLAVIKMVCRKPEGRAA